MSIETRLRKLEEAAGPPMPRFACVIVDGESEAEAARRQGIDLATEHVLFVHIVDPPPYRN
ncbi:MAG: hypothetical protein BroJett012_18880 [Betaproteobacteria bacterium]|nr:MAG: hypothetical protein BroJett012_18880 [Betaproteobacteria bacterium]